MATINFLIQSKKADIVPIYIRFRNGREVDLKAKTKLYIDPLEWSPRKQGPIKPQKSDDLVEIENQLNQLMTDLTEHFSISTKHNVVIDSAWLTRFIDKGVSNPNELPEKLVDYFDYYLKIKKTTIKATTYRKISTFKKFLNSFEEWAKRSYYLKDIDHNFRIALEEFGAIQKYANRYILDVLNYIKVIARHALRNGIIVNRQFEDFKIKREKGQFIYLDFEELKMIEKAELTADYLDNARDWLLISCETAQRVSDFIYFEKKNIKEKKNKDGVVVTLLEFTQEKTEKKMFIPLSSRVKTILEKRNGNFPRPISDVNYNKYIKLVCQKAGLTELIEGSKTITDPKTKITRKQKGIYPKYELVTSHIGRRSFASNHFGSIPSALIRTQTGHSSERTLLVYINKTETELAMNLADYLI